MNRAERRLHKRLRNAKRSHEEEFLYLHNRERWEEIFARRDTMSHSDGVKSPGGRPSA